MSTRGDYDFEVGFFESLQKRMPSDVRVVSMLAHLYTKTGRVDDGLRMDRKLVRLQPDEPISHYNLACSLALKHHLYADAVRCLRTAITLGYSDFHWMQHDPDLADLQDHPSYLALLAEFTYIVCEVVTQTDTRIVEVIALSGFDTPLAYAVPPTVSETIEVGSLVRIPLRRRSELAVVLQFGQSK